MAIINLVRKSLFLLITILLRLTAFAQVALPHESLGYNCLDQPFLSISVSVPRHDKFPNMDIGLVDPAGRTAGMEHRDHSIPHSQYGRVIEIPSLPELSKAVAIEICDPEPGAPISYQF